MKRENAIKLIHDNETLNLALGLSYGGMLKGIIKGANLSSIVYPFDCACLPKEMSLSEFKRCCASSKYDLRRTRETFTLNFSKYKRIIVWHDFLAHSILSLGFISLVKGCCQIYQIDTSKVNPLMRFGGLHKEEFSKAIDYLKKVSSRQLERYISIYKSFSSDIDEVRIAQNRRIKVISSDEIKSQILKIIKSSPMYNWKLIGYVEGKYIKKNIHFCTMVFEHCIFELLLDNKLNITGIKPWDEKFEYPHKPNIQPIIWEGYDIRLARGFYIVKA